MRKIAFSYVLSGALGIFLMPTVQAEGSVSDTTSDYRIPLYNNIEFKAEAAGDNRVSMSWTAFKGYKNEAFEYYKVIRSYSNPNPVYPEDGAIGVKKSIGDLRYVDEKAERSAYYRVCAITNVKGRHCSNVLWVEIEKPDKSETECENLAFDGTCEDTTVEKEKKEAQDKWKEKQDEAKKRLDERKEKQAEEKELRQKEWEAKKEAKEKEKEKQAEEKDAREKEREVKKEDQQQEHDTKKSEQEAERDKKKAEIYEKMYARLDSWLENFAKRLDQASISNADKIKKIEAVQEKFHAWENGKELRMKMVDHIDEGLKALKEKYAAGDDFTEIDAFLNGLLEG